MSEVPHDEIQKYTHWNWPHFKPSEFACKCCGNVLFTKESVAAWDKLQAMRDDVKQPIQITSAYRCKNHNAKVKGVKGSKHLQGIAFDIRITERMPRHLIHSAARKAGFTGFGDYKTFVHIDTGRARTWKG